MFDKTQTVTFLYNIYQINKPTKFICCLISGTLDVSGDQNSASNYVERLLTAYPYYTPPADLVADFNIALIRNCSAVAAERLENRGTVSVSHFKTYVFINFDFIQFKYEGLLFYFSKTQITYI